MRLDLDKMITVLSTIFAIVILSSTGVQGVMNDKLRKKLINSPYLKHVILIISIYTTKSYEILHIGKDDQKDFKKKYVKISNNLGIIIIFIKNGFQLCAISNSFSIGNKSLNDTKKQINLKIHY